MDVAFAVRFLSLICLLELSDLLKETHSSLLMVGQYNNDSQKWFLKSLRSKIDGRGVGTWEEKLSNRVPEKLLI